MDENVKLKNQTVFKEDNNGTTSTGLDKNIAGMLTYLVGFITGIIFLVIEKENRFVRFHALQSIIISAVFFIINIVLTSIPVFGWIIGILLAPFTFLLWIYLMFKAYQGKWVKLPIVGDMAEKQLNKMN